MIPALINLIIYLVVVGLIAGLVFYVVDVVPIAQPFNRLIKVALATIWDARANSFAAAP